jgi:parvulin-like peptidyl-prolyl isomerase
MNKFNLIINGEKVEWRNIEAEIERMRPRYEEVVRPQNKTSGDTELIEWAKDNVVEHVLIRQQACKDDAKSGQTKNSDKADPASESRRIQSFIEKLNSNVKKPEIGEIKEFYKQNKELFVAPEQVHAAHIVKHTGQGKEATTVFVEMMKIKEQLDSGAIFEEVASRSSDCPGNSGDLGYFARGQMVQEFDDVVFTMKPGDISDVFMTSFGYHIAKVHDRRPGGPVSFEQAREMISRRLHEDKRNKALEQYLDDLKQKAVIEEMPVDEKC